MSSSPVVEPSSPSTTPSSPALRADCAQFQTSTPYFTGRYCKHTNISDHHSSANTSQTGLAPKRAISAERLTSDIQQHPTKLKQPNPPLNVVLPAPAPSTPPTYGEATLTPPPRSPGASIIASPASGDRAQPPDGTSSDKSSETAVGGISRTTSTALSRKESYKAQRQHYRREKKRAASALLHSIEDPSVVVLADWLKVRGSLKSWTKLWCVLKPGLLLLYKSPKAKSSHWVGTVLLTSCQVIERPSKKDGFCFKLYHPLEQSIWAPRGPHNETIGAVVQPLPTAHLIFRAPSQAAGHCWLDGLELALRCSNAMLRCSRSRPEQTVAADSPATQTNLSHEDLEKHFNEHEPSSCSSPLMSISDYSPKRPSSIDRKVTYQVPKKPKTRKTKWAQFMESIEIMAKDHDSSDPPTPERDSRFLDFLWRKETGIGRNTASTSSMKMEKAPKIKRQMSKSLASSPYKLEVKKSPILKCLELPKLPLERSKDKLSPTSMIEENFMKFMATFPKRRSSTPITFTQKRISELRESGVKTDSENDDVFIKAKRKLYKGSEIICDTPENIIIKTAPSAERVREYTSSSTDEAREQYRKSRYPPLTHTPDKYSVIDYDKLPSASYLASNTERRDDRYITQNVYVAGKIIKTELAGAASDSDSEVSRTGMLRRQEVKKEDILARIASSYVEDTNVDIGQAGELVEEVAEENKSLLWFLLKQVRPGMDLSKVVLPTFILEPRSFLDKLSDNYYHADLLGQAQLIEDPYQRFVAVLRWYLSGLYRKPKGLKKPYNPVLGETFRCCWQHSPESYTYYVAEQVSHHPPVSAFYVTNRKEGFVIEGSLLARSKFYGNSTSAILEGCARVHLLNWGETYITTAPYAHCKGIVIGTLSMELGGKVHVMCPDTGYQADVEFKLRSFLGGSDQTNAIHGRIKRGKDTVAVLEGYWDAKIDMKDKKTGEESNLLDIAVLKEQRLPRFLMNVEKQYDYESEKLWIKVSEAIANDDQIAATEQKTIIEEAQRTRARHLVAPWVPRYFHRDLSPNPPEGVIDQGWVYNHVDITPWQPEEVIEYEEDFVIKTLRDGPPSAKPVEPRGSISITRPLTDSDSHDDLARRSKTNSARTLKQSLLAIDTALREQTMAIDRLSKTVDTISEGQRQAAAYRPQNLGRMPTTSHTWDLFGGFVLAMVMQALLNWIFYQKD